jgi:hypothetical protein
MREKCEVNVKKDGFEGGNDGKKLIKELNLIFKFLLVEIQLKLKFKY